jgi:hypothetical protein
MAIAEYTASMRATIAAITQIRHRSIAASSALIAAAALRCIAPAGLAACPLLADCRLSSQAKGSSFSRKSARHDSEFSNAAFRRRQTI